MHIRLQRRNPAVHDLLTIAVPKGPSDFISPLSNLIISGLSQVTDRPYASFDQLYVLKEVSDEVLALKEIILVSPGDNFMLVSFNLSSHVSSGVSASCVPVLFLVHADIVTAMIQLATNTFNRCFLMFI